MTQAMFSTAGTDDNRLKHDGLMVYVGSGLGECGLGKQGKCTQGHEWVDGQHNIGMRMTAIFNND